MRPQFSTYAEPGAGFRLRRRRGPRPDRRIAVGRPARVAATAGALVLGLVLVGAGTGTTFFFDDDRPKPDVELEREFQERLAAIRARGFRTSGERLPGWLDAILAVVAVVTILVVAAALLYGLWRGLRALRRLRLLRMSPGRSPDGYDPGDTSGDDAEEAVRRKLRRGFDAGAFDLPEAGEAREAVIACYQRMERTVAEAGTPRRLHETPAELLARVLVEHDVPPGSVVRLTELYEEARYSAHVVDDDMRATARRCLDDVRAAL